MVLRRLGRFALFAGFNLLAVVGLLLLLEGLASFYLVIRDHSRRQGHLAERKHTEYDAEIGWVNLPNVRIDDMYGPDVWLETNSSRSRDSRQHSKHAPGGISRILCSGDSFTLGYGVSNVDTWCSLLESRIDSVETMNFGQGGYGVDQSYLLYRRVRKDIQHDIHIFAVILSDFHRMKRNRFWGYGKPLLREEDGELVVSNMPVPRYGFGWRAALRGLRSLQYLRLTQLFSTLGERTAQNKEDPESEQQSREMQRIARLVLEDLAQMSADDGQLLVLVLLPTEQDYFKVRGKFYRRMMSQLAKREEHVLYVDLIGALRKRPSASIQNLFLQDGELDLTGGAGHYSVQGNRFIAGLLAERLATDYRRHGQPNPESASEGDSRPPN